MYEYRTQGRSPGGRDHARFADPALCPGSETPEPGEMRCAGDDVHVRFILAATTPRPGRGRDVETATPVNQRKDRSDVTPYLSILLVMFLSSDLYAQWYVAGFVGKTINTDADVVVEEPGTNIRFFGVEFDDQSFNTPLYYGIRGGYLFTSGFGIEGEFIHSKVFAHLDTPVDARGNLRDVPVDAAVAPNVVFLEYGVSHGVNLLLANLVRRQSLHQRLDLVLRGGAGSAFPHPEIRVFDRSLHEYQPGGLSLQIAAGLEFPLTSHWAALGEYKFTATRVRFELPPSGSVETLFRTNHFVTGLKLRF
jgi:hypothetical protein